MGLDPNGGFVPVGLARHGWATTDPIRDIFRRAFERAGLPYYNPHSFRDMLVRHAMTLDLTPEEMKAWSQNLGHADVLTTFTSYGTVPVQRQGELIRAGAGRSDHPGMDDGALLAALVARLGKVGRRDLPRADDQVEVCGKATPPSTAAAASFPGAAGHDRSPARLTDSANA